MSRTFIAPSLSFTVVLAAASMGCGGPDKPAEDASDNDQRRRSNRDSTAEIGMMAEIGAMPEEETVYAFKSSFGRIQDCFLRGAERIEFIGGDIAIFIQVNASGNPEYIYAKHSTIGDRETEKCMFRALERASWPAPVGGLIGIAENSFDFEMTGDVRPPVSWDATQVDETLADNAEKIQECKRGTSGRFTATAYVDTNGRAISVGISPPSNEGEAQSDCLVGVLKQAEFPSPGSWAAKVTFTL